MKPHPLILLTSSALLLPWSALAQDSNHSANPDQAAERIDDTAADRDHAKQQPGKADHSARADQQHHRGHANHEHGEAGHHNHRNHADHQHGDGDHHHHRGHGAHQHQRVQLGIHVQPLNASARTELGLNAPVGLIVRAVRRDSVAADLGLHQGDVLLSFNRDRLVAVEQLAVLVAATEPGARVRLTILRDGQRSRIAGPLAKPQTDCTPECERKDQEPAAEATQQESEPAQGQEAQPEQTQPEQAQPSTKNPDDQPALATEPRYLGVLVVPTADGSGLQVKQVLPASAASTAGVQVGDILLAIGDKQLANPADVHQALDASTESPANTLTIQREDEELELPLSFESTEDSQS